MIDLTQDAVVVAPLLLGWKLVHMTPAGRISGYIVETEAYRSDDPASHTFRGQTLRNAPMFDRAGTIYVYFTYGMHYCMNIVTGGIGHGQAVLIRALQPLEGIDIMQQNRKSPDPTQLTNGPAKLTQALGIDKLANNTYVNMDEISLEPGFVPEHIVHTTRVGIKQAIDHPWRFYVAANPHVSRLAKA